MNKQLKLESIKNYIHYLYTGGNISLLEEFVKECIESNDVDCLNVLKELEESGRYPVLKNIIIKVRLSLEKDKYNVTVSEKIFRKRFKLVSSDHEEEFDRFEVIDKDVKVFTNNVDKDLEEYLKIKELIWLYPGTWKDRLRREFLEKELKKIGVDGEFKHIHPARYRRIVKKVNRKLKDLLEIYEGVFNEDYKD